MNISDNNIFSVSDSPMCEKCSGHRNRERAERNESPTFPRPRQASFSAEHPTAPNVLQSSYAMEGEDSSTPLAPLRSDLQSGLCLCNS